MESMGKLMDNDILGDLGWKENDLPMEQNSKFLAERTPSISKILDLNF